MSRDVDIKDAQHRWYDILSGLGLPTSALRNKHGPCPMCGGKDRFRWDDKEGRGTWFCTNCGAGDGADLAMKFLGIDFKGLMERMAPLMGTAKHRKHVEKIMSEAERKRLLNDLWNSSTQIASGDPVDRYLRSRALGSGWAAWPKALRTLVRDTGATMLARVCDRNGNPITVHRTFLSPDGKKAAGEASRKLMPGKVPHGIAVRLLQHGKVLGIAEGIETAMSAAVLFGIPVWAALTAGFLETWYPPSDVECVYVFGDNDSSYTGQEAAYILARRLVLTEKKEVKVEIPEQTNTDWNDVLAANLVYSNATKAVAQIEVPYHVSERSELVWQPGR